MKLDRQKSFGKRYESACVKLKLNRRKIFIFLLPVYLIGFIAVGVLWALGV